MAVTFGFYNSLDGDRIYDALQMSSMFDGVITDGVFENFLDEFFVEESSGMTIQVNTGRAWFNHTWTLNDTVLPLTIEDSDLIYPRVDTVILEVDSSNEVRTNTIKVLTGTPAAIPSHVELINTAELNQYTLAYVQVPTGASSIVNANITNTVGTYLCPFATFPSGGAGGANVLEVQVFS